MRVAADLAQRDSPSRRANTGALFELVDSGRGCGAAVRDAEPEFAFPTDRCGWESLVSQPPVANCVGGCGVWVCVGGGGCVCGCMWSSFHGGCGVWSVGGPWLAGCSGGGSRAVICSRARGQAGRAWAQRRSPLSSTRPMPGSGTARGEASAAAAATGQSWRGGAAARGTCCTRWRRGPRPFVATARALSGTSRRGTYCKGAAHTHTASTEPNQPRSHDTAMLDKPPRYPPQTGTRSA